MPYRPPKKEKGAPRTERPRAPTLTPRGRERRRPRGGQLQETGKGALLQWYRDIAAL